MQTATHHGRETAYRQTQPDADGPTALYVHGSGGNHQLWVHQYAPSGPTHPAVAVDLSGHGESQDIETPAGPKTLRKYAEDVAVVAQETEADILVGNSLGGAVVFEVLLSELYEPTGVVFAGSGAKLAVNEELRTALKTDFPSAIEMVHQPSMLFADPDKTMLEQSKATIQKAGQRVTTRDFLTCHVFDVREELDAISIPALAVVGGEDMLTPPFYHEYLAEHMPSCTDSVIEDAGHLVMLEQPEAFNLALESFFSEI